MVAPLPCHVIILPLRNLSWVVPDQSLSRTVRVAVKPSDEPLRKGETVKARRPVVRATKLSTRNLWIYPIGRPQGKLERKV